MSRVVSVWLPRFQTDRLHRLASARRSPVQKALRRSPAPARPLVTAVAVERALRIGAVDAAAEAAGIVPGLTLADARALCPGLAVAPADPAGDGRSLADLAAWCGRYSPWTGVDRSAVAALGGGRGLWLDVSGCAHLFGGEAALLADLVGRLRGAGYAVRAALADTPGGAWAAARFLALAPERPWVAIPAGMTRAVIETLPVAALRLAPDTVAGLERMGLHHIAALFDKPRATLAARFGDDLLRRLDQALGALREPISPRTPVPPLRLAQSYAEPLADAAGVTRTLEGLLGELAAEFARQGLGARRLAFTLYRADGSAATARIGTSRPSRDAAHLARLFAEPVAALDLGFGADGVTLTAELAASLADRQLDLRLPTQPPPLPQSLHQPLHQPLHQQCPPPRRAVAVAGGAPAAEPANDRVAALIDRLGNRLGLGNVVRLRAAASHLPERAVRAVAPLRRRDGDGGGTRAGEGAVPASPQADLPRPVCLFLKPEPVEVVAPVPDDPPVLFRWRKRVHRVAWAEGPERLGAEWWRGGEAGAMPMPLATRDYYRVEDNEGRRFWLYRSGLYRNAAAVANGSAASGGPGAAAPGVPAWFVHGLFA